MLLFFQSQVDVVVAGFSAGTVSLEYSSNGDGSWMSVSPMIFSQAFGLAYGLDDMNIPMWVAVGDPGSSTIAHSYDGVAWTGQGRASLANGGYSVAYSAVQKRWVAVGTSGSDVIVYSASGKRGKSVPWLGFLVFVVVSCLVLNKTYGWLLEIT